ncbi:MAG TPA: DinB family protein [Chthonomonadales bacterium]|nr:DinB family protein [Chthonomonadales bacterium]
MRARRKVIVEMPLADIRRHAAEAASRATTELLRAAHAIPADRHLWRPGGLAHHTVRIVAHCGASNLFHAAVLAQAPLPFRTEEEHSATVNGCQTLDAAAELLRRGAQALLDAIAAMPDERLGEPMVMPWGERQPVLAGILEPVLHMHRHAGQLEYIQMLLGDDNYH